MSDGAPPIPLKGYTRVRLISLEAGLITELAVPPFDIMPEVILWGHRAFVYHVSGSTDVYREVTSYAAPFKEEDWP